MEEAKTLITPLVRKLTTYPVQNDKVMRTLKQIKAGWVTDALVNRMQSDRDDDAYTRRVARQALEALSWKPSTAQEMSLFARALNISAFVVREGTTPPTDTQTYVGSIWTARHGPEPVEFIHRRIVGMPAAFDTADAAELYLQMGRAHKLWSHSSVEGVTSAFEGTGPDGQHVVAFFTGGVSSRASQGRGSLSEPYLRSHSGGKCFSCGSAVSLNHRYPDQATGHRLYEGSICFRCLSLFCVTCLGGSTDVCPVCKGKAKPALEKHIALLTDLTGYSPDPLLGY
jgi:hypothetical protein